MNANTLNAILNYVPVSANIASAGQPRENQLHLIADAGFEVVINLALHDDPRYSLSDEAGSVRSLGMLYEHIPVIFNRPEEKDLLAFFAAMEKYSGRKLFVHCAANKRVSAFLGLYFAVRKKQEHEKAFALMRDVWEPDEIWSSFIATMLKKHTAGRETGRKGAGRTALPGISAIRDYLHEHIPLSKAMGVDVRRADESGIILSAPLGPNINHRETVFGGSASSLAILAAWAVVNFGLRREGLTCRVVIQKNTMTYDRPMAGEFSARCDAPDAEQWLRFVTMVKRKKMGRITIASTLICNAEMAGRMEGVFVAVQTG